MSKRKLTGLQERFCYEYVRDLNATQAAIRAGYSPKGARVTGTKLLANANISQKIAELKGEIHAELKLDAKETLHKVNCMASADIFDVVKIKDGKLIVRDSDTLPPEIRIAVRKVKQTKDGSFAVELEPKTTALDMLMKHLGLYDEDAAKEPWIEPEWRIIEFDPQNPPAGLIESSRQ